MALMKSSGVPKDAVLMSEEEATNYVWELVSEWDNTADTWALRHGPEVLGGLNALAGIIINRHYRNKLKLGTFGYFSSVLPITLMPGLLTSLFHRHLVSTEMLLLKNNACPICYEVKATSIQLLFGVAYPMALGPLSALLFANRYSTYRVPQLSEGPKIMFKFVRKLTKPFHGTLAMMGVAQFVAASAITYFEMKNNVTLRTKMLELENEMESKKMQ